MFDSIDQILADPLGYYGGYPQRQQQQTNQIDAANKAAISQPLGQDEQNSLLQNMLGTGASALSFAGSTLNKLFGGRAIRAGLGMLSGSQVDPTELLSFLPGSDIAGLTDEKNQVTGRHLLDRWGVTSPAGEDESFWSPSNLAGIATDVATDPASYLTFGAGAATRAGQSAEKLGILPKNTLARIKGYQTPEAAAAALGFKTVPEAEQFAQSAGQNLGDILNRPLGGVAGLRVPFTSAADSGAILGTGAGGERIAQTIGKPFQWLAGTKPAAYLRAQFNPLYEGVTDPIQQSKMLQEAPYAARRSEQFNRGTAEAYQQLLADMGGRLPPEHVAAARAAFEGTPLPATLTPEAAAAYGRAGQAATNLKNQYADIFRSAGGNLADWESIFGTQHAYRAPTPLEQSEPIWRGGTGRENLARANYAGVAPALERQAMFDIPGGTNRINELVRNPEIGTQARTITPGGLDLGWLKNDAGRAQTVEDRLSQAMGLLSPGEQQEYMALRERLGTGPLQAQDQGRYDTLRQQYLASRGQARNVVRSDVLGGYDPRELTALRKMNLNGLPMTQQQAERMAQLEAIDKASRYSLGKLGRLYGGRVPAPGEYADAADQFLPRIKGAMQDTAAADYLRQTLGADTDRLAELTQKAGVTPDVIRQLVEAAPADRRTMLQSLQSPGPNGRGNMLSQVGDILHPNEANELLQQAHLERIAQPLAHYLGQLNPARQTVGLFNNDPFADLHSYGRQLIKGTGKANVVTSLLGEHAVPTTPADTGVGGVSQVPVGSILDQLRLDTPQANAIVARGMAGRLGNPFLAGDVGKAGVPQEIADALMQLAPRAKTPEYAAGPLRMFDAGTQLTRASITAPWPGFHVRNFTTDEMNVLQRMGPGGVGWGPTASSLARGENPAELLNLPMVRAAGITDPAEAARLVGREAYATGAFGPGVGRLGGDVFNQDTSLLRGIPGAVPQPSMTDIMAGKTLPPNWSVNPMNIQGLMGQTETRFAPAAWGRSVAEQEDTFARGGAFLHLLNQGYAPSAAADTVKGTVYSGANFTPFEQNVMRRLMPFWGYTKYVVPQQAQFLAEHPGGLAAQGVRLASAARGNGFLPEYLSGGLAVPLGREEDGTQRYLSKLDMPWESLFDLAKPGPNLNATVANTGMNLLSQLNPLIKGPLEGAVNKQFLTGRDLDSLYGGFSGVSAIDNMLFNSPASRLATTINTLKDPRKYQSLESAAALPLNLLTGAKVTDVDMEKQRGIAELHALREYLMHDPNAQQHLDFTPKSGQELTPQEIQVFQLLKTLNAQNQKASAQRKAGQ